MLKFAYNAPQFKITSIEETPIMSNKSAESSSKNKKNSEKKGLSTFTKVLLSILLILAICVAGFIFHAWQILHKPIENNVTIQAASIEVLTPSGAQVNSNVQTTFVPNPVTMAASDQALALSSSDTVDITATPAKPVVYTPQIAHDDDDLKPILPTNLPATTTKTNDGSRTTKQEPPANTNKQLDNLF